MTAGAFLELLDTFRNPYQDPRGLGERPVTGSPRSQAASDRVAAEIVQLNTSKSQLLGDVNTWNTSLLAKDGHG